MTIPCSILSRQSGEPMYGSCGGFDHWVFVSLPISKWHAKSALQSHGMPSDLTAWLGEELAKKVTISLRVYDDLGVAEGKVKVKLRPAGEEIVLNSLSEVTAALRKRIGGDASGWTAIEGKEFFICNDPGHDACCAKYGPPVFAAASAHAAAGKLPITVFRSSHLGGHKFAATGIVWPAGHMYGRMDAKNVANIIEATVSDDIFAPNYRGTVTLSKDEQAATYVAASRGWLDGPIKRIRVNEIVEEEERRHLHAEVPGAMPFTVTLIRKKFLSPGSCGRSAEEPVDRWVISEIDGQPV